LGLMVSLRRWRGIPDPSHETQRICIYRDEPEPLLLGGIARR
jgi:hypothetical protein